jgi:16S rRNA (guanine(1405)-N(7))-methyltransferase
LRQYQADKQKIEDLKKQLEQLIQNTFRTPDSPQIKHIINELLLTHISTKERINDYQAFYQEVFALIAPPRTILDIGCGIHPLSYPFEQPEYRPEVYVAIDNQPEVIETLTIFAPYIAPTHLIPVCVDIAEVNWMSYLEREIDTFDVAFILKLIPVISRQQRNLLSKLANVPARQMIITATTEAMTRKENIRKREERVLCDFIEMTDKKIMATFQIGNEFGYVIGETGGSP